MDALGVRAKDGLYVGDGYSEELTGAANLGLHAVLLRATDLRDDGHLTGGKVNGEAATWSGPSIETLSQVLRFLD